MVGALVSESQVNNRYQGLRLHLDTPAMKTTRHKGTHSAALADSVVTAKASQTVGMLQQKSILFNVGCPRQRVLCRPTRVTLCATFGFGRRTLHYLRPVESR